MTCSSTGPASALLYLGVLIAWTCVAAGIAIVRLYTWLDNLPPHNERSTASRSELCKPQQASKSP
ncbi:hypothetical protein [Kutzneria sp. CA-103260]|uniref:hypothetical protein n=1 Tax=Kutzneria sp. CA-103260 TaxID=2802641 RepID=UPI001BAC5C2D|nr:hypothetical protein [Kutzneria sp. CA-103260]